MNDNGISKSKKFLRTLIINRFGPLALFSFKCMISKLYCAQFTSVSTVGRPCCNSDPSQSTDKIKIPSKKYFLRIQDH